MGYLPFIRLNDVIVSREIAQAVVLRAATLLVAFAYFASGISLREASLLESQDLGIAADLLDTFAITADHSPLHFVFLDLWQHLNTHSIAFLRLPSAFACSVAALIVLLIGEREGGLLGGVLSAALFVLNPLVVDNARSMRMYAWVLLFCTGGLVSRPRRAFHNWSLPLASSVA